jgi:cardiolipin synthase C
MEDTRLGRSVMPLARSHAGKSGVFALRHGRDAFAARALLADAAERTLDIQYYIWRDDMSGTLLLAALRRAADRGVRVRLLLDDNNTAGLDPILAALDAHANIEVRLFNPFKTRRWRWLGYLTDFARLNRRMHNKSFTADAQVTIIGGRNVGDEYFGAAHDVLFVDLDVLAIGPVVASVSEDFERYWESESSYPAARVLPAADPRSLSRVATTAFRTEHDPASVAYLRALAESRFVADLPGGHLPFEWATVSMVSDDPAKGRGRAADDAFLWPRLKRILKAPARELQLISPYFVPTAAGVEFFVALARQGVKITVLTNALEATDVAIVHAGYAKWRRPLLDAGIELFEIKRAASGPPVREHGVAGSSGSSLHAKTFSVDRSHVFIGSFNFDPRSARLNTELGFVIESPAMAQASAEAFASRVPANSYRLRLSDSGALQWVEQTDDAEIVHDQEPGTSFWLRLAVRVMSRLPIEWLL